MRTSRREVTPTTESLRRADCSRQPAVETRAFWFGPNARRTSAEAWIPLRKLRILSGGCVEQNSQAIWEGFGGQPCGLFLGSAAVSRHSTNQ